MTDSDKISLYFNGTLIMIKPCLYLIFLSILCLSSTGFAASRHFPEDLLYKGKPIDSLCFSNPDNNKIDLDHCGAKQEKYDISGVSAELKQKGYTGYDWKDPGISSDVQGYTYYQYFDAGNHQYWIYSINSGGGSGHFTNVYLTKRLNSNTLSVETIAGGDRCNGGIQDVSTKNNALSFSINLTAYDLIDLSKSKIKNLNAYDDLAACAVCCVAKSYYTIESNAKLQFDHVDLGADVDVAEMPDQGKYQICFNKLFVSYQNKKVTILNQDKVNQFVDEFKNSCISDKHLMDIKP